MHRGEYMDKKGLAGYWDTVSNGFGDALTGIKNFGKGLVGMSSNNTLSSGFTNGNTYTLDQMAAGGIGTSNWTPSFDAEGNTISYFNASTGQSLQKMSDGTFKAIGGDSGGPGVFGTLGAIGQIGQAVGGILNYINARKARKAAERQWNQQLAIVKQNYHDMITNQIKGEDAAANVGLAIGGEHVNNVASSLGGQSYEGGITAEQAAQSRANVKSQHLDPNALNGV